MQRIALLLTTLASMSFAFADVGGNSAPAESVSADRLARALLITPDTLKLCDSSKQYTDLVQSLIQDDLRSAGLGGVSKSAIGDYKTFTAEERKLATYVPGFVPPKHDNLEEEAIALHEQYTKILERIAADGQDEDKRVEMRKDASELLLRLQSGAAVAEPAELLSGCMFATFAWLDKEKGPFIDRYRLYLRELAATYQAYRSTEGYQAARWGMLPEEVARAEGLTDGSLKTGKTVRIDDRPAKVSYEFTDGRLSEVKVAFTSPCKSGVCMEQYRSVTALLSEKYGPYQDNSATDVETLERTASRLYGELARPEGLIEDGYHREEHRWQQDDSVIVHQLYSNRKPLLGGSEQLLHEIRYSSKKLLPRANFLRQEKKKQQQKSRLQNL